MTVARIGFLIAILLTPVAALSQDPPAAARLRIIEKANEQLEKSRRKLQSQISALASSKSAKAAKARRPQSSGKPKPNPQDARRATARCLKIQRQFEVPMLKWFRDLSKASDPQESLVDSGKTVRDPSLSARYLQTWMRVGEPVGIRLFLQNKANGLLTTILSADLRRELLAAASARLGLTPGRTDLQDFVEILQWEALFLANFDPGRPLANALSADLILLFTQRDLNAIAKSKVNYYRPQRFRDSGFRLDLQDGSDQVRHFCWAFRMMAQARDRKTAAMMLVFKERRDAAVRKLPINQADLKLNIVARQLFEELLSGKARGLNSESMKVSALNFPQRVQQQLGALKSAPEPEAKNPR